jgi:hypothetical protein
MRTANGFQSFSFSTTSARFVVAREARSAEAQRGFGHMLLLR